MENIMNILHILFAIIIISLILAQRSKGSETGASFGAGSSSQTVFGSQGSNTFLVKVTIIITLLFVINSVILTKMSYKSMHNINTEQFENIDVKAENNIFKLPE